MITLGKAKGIGFTLFACGIICWKILTGRTWNILMIDLEGKGGRKRWWYRRTFGGYTFEEDRIFQARGYPDYKD